MLAIVFQTEHQKENSINHLVINVFMKKSQSMSEYTTTKELSTWSIYGGKIDIHTYRKKGGKKTDEINGFFEHDIICLIVLPTYINMSKNNVYLLYLVFISISVTI